MPYAEISLEEIRTQAQRQGFDDVALTPAVLPEADVAFTKDWLSRGFQGDLAYLENPVRLDPQAFMPGAKTAILFASYYKDEQAPFQEGKGVVASYARGRDYHNVHRRRLKWFIRWLEERSGQAGCARGFSDSAPVLEKALAAQAGLGWMGKNTLLIHRRFGTFFLLAGLLTTLELPTNPLEDARFPRCGTCTRCLDACPTQALTPYQLNATKCLSYHLIEHKTPEPPEISDRNPGYVLGCDICQDVCPHNKRKPTSDNGEFSPESGVGRYLSVEDVEQFAENPELLHGTPVKRRGVEGLRYTLSTLTSRQ